MADTTDVSDLLFSYYQVPRDQIHLLIGKAASRSNIISALDNLSTDPRIQPGDPILIYFAGYGSQIYPSRGWECGSGPGSKIHVLVPQDYSSKPSLEIPAISDRAIGLLIDEIAHRKGDNIVRGLFLNSSGPYLTVRVKTLIFDCCHAASGVRGDPVRSVELDPSILTNILDIQSRDNGAPPSGLTSHILFAACRPSEFAREINGRGAFTTELLKVLRAHPPDKLKYRDILHKINSIDG